MLRLILKDGNSSNCKKKLDDFNNACRYFPSGPVVKKLPANVGSTGSSPCPGRFLMLRG